ncbi:MAG TPA: efflux RND transporter periplasmic adaptor subunit [Microlunatus sp.]|nr:efflux RND transporter periplasmic adaptor subunit [Microlunatus sp.]
MTDRRHRRPPLPVLIVVIVLLAAVGGYLWWRSTHQSAQGPLTASGAMEAQQYQVAAAIAGRVTAVKAAEGDSVSKGQTVIVLDSTALKLQLNQARQGVKAAEAAVKNAKDDGTDADVAAAKARLNQAEASVDLAKLQLGYAAVKAPHAGVAVTVTTNAGQNTGPGKTLLTLSDPNDLFVRVFVTETQIGHVTIGQHATVTTDSLSTSFPGTVSFVSSQAEFTPNNVETADQRTKLVFEVRIRISDSSHALKAGMPVAVEFS